MKKTKNNFIWKVISCAAIIILFCTNISFANYSWKQKTDFPGAVRKSPIAFEINGKGYLGTGISGVTNVSDFWEYDATTDVWTQKADYGGGPRQGAASFAIGGKGYAGIGTSTYPVYT